MNDDKLQKAAFLIATIGEAGEDVKHCIKSGNPKGVSDSLGRVFAAVDDLRQLGPNEPLVVGQKAFFAGIIEEVGDYQGSLKVRFGEEASNYHWLNADAKRLQ